MVSIIIWREKFWHYKMNKGLSIYTTITIFSNINGISSSFKIFKNWCVLIVNSVYRKNKPIAWDGMLRRQPLPTSDYWYVIIINGQRRVGHFTLKR